MIGSLKVEFICLGLAIPLSISLEVCLAIRSGSELVLIYHLELWGGCPFGIKWLCFFFCFFEGEGTCSLLLWGIHQYWDPISSHRWWRLHRNLKTVVMLLMNVTDCLCVGLILSHGVLSLKLLFGLFFFWIGERLHVSACENSSLNIIHIICMQYAYWNVHMYCNYSKFYLKLSFDVLRRTQMCSIYLRSCVVNRILGTRLVGSNSICAGVMSLCSFIVALCTNVC